MTDLAQKKCVPCEGGMPPLNAETMNDYKRMLKSAWEVQHIEGEEEREDGGGKKLHQEFKFKDFRQAMKFVNKVADLAEVEGHHPDIYIYYNKVILDLTTHAVDGLSENDFIMARKIELMREHESN